MQDYAVESLGLVRGMRKGCTVRNGTVGFVMLSRNVPTGVKFYFPPKSIGCRTRATRRKLDAAFYLLLYTLMFSFGCGLLKITSERSRKKGLI